MKIINNDAIYVQKNDILNLIQMNIPIPTSVFSKAFKDGGISINNDKSRFKFIKFDEKSEIEFFNRYDFIMDFNELNMLSSDELVNIGQKYIQARMKLEKQENKDSNIENELLGYKLKVASIVDMIQYKEGIVNFIIPNKIDLEELQSNKKSI